MSRKLPKIDNPASFFRSYLVTAGLAIGLVGCWAATHEPAHFSTWPAWEILTIGGMMLFGAGLICAGLFGPTEKMQSFAELSGTHEASLIFFVLAFPVHAVLKHFYRDD